MSFEKHETGKGAINQQAHNDILALPSVPTQEMMRCVEFAAEHGWDMATVLQGTGISPELLTDPMARLCAYQCTGLMARVKNLTGVEALGYELGMRFKLTQHGMLGFGVLSSSNLLEAIDMAMRFFELRNLTFRLNWRMIDQWVVLELQDLAPHAPMRQTAIESIIVGWACLGRDILLQSTNMDSLNIKEAMITFPWPEPTYHADYIDRAPLYRFNDSIASLRFPLIWLTQKLTTASSHGVLMAQQICEKELQVITPVADITSRVRNILSNCETGYPSLEAVATSFNMSISTLKRRLQHEGFRFGQLLDEARLRDATQLLEHSSLCIEEIAVKLGYQNRSNFTQAFRKWMKTTPCAYRNNTKVDRPGQCAKPQLERTT